MIARPNAALGLTREQEVAKLNAWDAAHKPAARLLTDGELPQWLQDVRVAHVPSCDARLRGTPVRGARALARHTRPS